MRRPRFTSVTATTRPFSVVVAVALSALVACGRTPVASAPVDVECGATAPTRETYDARAFDCFWSAQGTGRSVRLAMTPLTIEGDPIPMVLTYTRASGFEVTRDVRADKFSAAADRRVWTWRCTKLAKRPWSTDPSRYSFELTGCTGDGPATTFP